MVYTQVTQGAEFRAIIQTFRQRKLTKECKHLSNQSDVALLKACFILAETRTLKLLGYIFMASRVLQSLDNVQLLIPTLLVEKYPLK